MQSSMENKINRITLKLEIKNRCPNYSKGVLRYVEVDIMNDDNHLNEQIHKMLDEAGVATVAGTSFGALGEGFIRFSYAASVEDIERACEKVQRMLS